MAEMPLIKIVRLKADELTVETQDSSRFVDVNPHAKQGGVDYYIMGETTSGTRLPEQAVPLPGAPMPLVKTHAAKLKAKLRQTEADPTEASRAQFYFGSGKALAEQYISEFNQAVAGGRGIQTHVNKPTNGLPPNKILTMRVTFKNAAGQARQANVSFKMMQYNDGQFQWQLTGYTLSRGAVKVHVVDPAVLGVVEKQLSGLYRQFISGKDGIEAQLRKFFEKVLTERQRQESGSGWHE